MRKEPRQSRSRVTVEAILDAGARILSDEGWAAFTTNRVAEVAGVSIGSLYQYFPDKLSLVDAIRSRHLEEPAATSHQRHHRCDRPALLGRRVDGVELGHGEGEVPAPDLGGDLGGAAQRVQDVLGQSALVERIGCAVVALRVVGGGHGSVPWTSTAAGWFPRAARSSPT